MVRQQEKEAGQACAENRHKSLQGSPASRIHTLIAALFVGFPPIVFYTVLFRNALDIPNHDDYYVPLSFLNQLVLLKTISEKATLFLTFQHNEYKLFFLQALAWLQLVLCGHVSLTLLDAIGNGFVLLLGFLLWKMFLPTHRDFATRLAFFIPVSCLLFQLQYWETLNWASTGLQHLAVLPFSFGAIYLLVRGRRWAFCSALAFLILAVASDGNGFLLIPIGVLILALRRRYAHLAVWLLASIGCVAVYAYHYNVMSSQTNAHHSVFSTFHPLNLAYVISFIGSAGGFPFQSGSLLLGSLLCMFFIYMAYRGYLRKNPLVSYCVLFLLLTTIGVSGIRSGFGVAQSLSSRYAIYSALFLVFAWFAIVEEFLQHRRVSPLGNGFFLGAAAAAILFSLCMDWVGSITLEKRNLEFIQAMTAFEHPASPGSTVGPAPLLPLPPNSPEIDEFNRESRAILIQSIKLGVYRPPPYPSVDAH
jgi:hypothetical protein